MKGDYLGHRAGARLIGWRLWLLDWKRCSCKLLVCGGRLRINGTRITVIQVAAMYRQGLSAEDIEQSYVHLNLAQVYAALAYYHANREEVIAELRAEDELYEQLKQEPSKQQE